jgi:hypothetical protein
VPSSDAAFSAQDCKIANPDNDKTLSKQEYLKDGTVNAAEARTHVGRVLLRLLRALTSRDLTQAAASSEYCG